MKASGFGLRAPGPVRLAVLVLLVAATSAQAQSVASLFTTLPSDFAHLLTPANGLIVADQGSGWYFTGASDTAWDDDDLGQLKGVPGSAFEAVETGPIVRP